MSASALPAGNLTVAWAAQVSLPQLGARLTAYFQTRATITVFRLAARDAPSSAIRRLPEEILSIIAGFICEIVYQSKIEFWINIERCLANHCDPLFHFTHYEMTKRYRCCTNWMTGDEISYDDFSQETCERHEEVTGTSYQELAAVDGESEITKFAKVCAHILVLYGVLPTSSKQTIKSFSVSTSMSHQDRSRLQCILIY